MEPAKLEEFNGWWIDGKVDERLALSFKRDIYSEVEERLSNRFIIALTGLRRIGKTTIMYQLIQKLIEEKTKKTNILFFSFDEISVKFSEVLEAYMEIQKKNLREERVYIFLDEVQKCLGWENEIKKYYDLYPRLKFIISGSESLFIRRKSKETLAGRILEFMLTPFTFREYLRFKGIKETDFKYETKIMPLFTEFAETGGFPETFLPENKKDIKNYIRSLVVDRIIYKDIPKIFKLEEPEFLGVLLELIATNPGVYVDYQSLSRQFGKDRRVIKNYISYLKESFLVTVLGNYRKGSITSLRKKKRAYPSDTALIYLYKPKIEGGFFGRIAETIAVNKLKATCFWKNGHEVDIIHDGIPIEIKYQEKLDQNDCKEVLSFMKKFNKREGMIITKKEEKDLRFDEGKIKFVPLWKWLLEEKAH